MTDLCKTPEIVITTPHVPFSSCSTLNLNNGAEIASPLQKSVISSRSQLFAHIAQSDRLPMYAHVPNKEGTGIGTANHAKYCGIPKLRSSQIASQNVAGNPHNCPASIGNGQQLASVLRCNILQQQQV